MNHRIVGLRREFLFAAFSFSFINLVCLFFPYATMHDEHIMWIGLLSSGSSVLFPAFLFVVCISILLELIIIFRPSVKTAKILTAILTAQVAVITMLLFASKSILDNTTMITEKFMVKNFGLGYWGCLLGSYMTLIFTMKMAKINTGYVFLSLLAIIWLFPISWILLTAFRKESGFYVGYFLPKGLTIQNFKDLFNNPYLPFSKWFGNTFIVAICNCVLSTIIVLGTAFILSRTRFKGRKAFMNILMIIGMFPGFMSMVAVYNLLKAFGLNQSLLTLVIVGVAGAAMGYHVCKGYFDTIPKALDEAALIDGATRFQIFTKITLPLSKPIAVYTLLTSFLGTWSDYIFPAMLFGDNKDLYTVAVGLKWMTDTTRIDTYYTQFAAGSVLIAVPIVILFMCLQKYYVEGLSGSVKG